jgi:hypothetical protein
MTIVTSTKNRVKGTSPFATIKIETPRNHFFTLVSLSVSLPLLFGTSAVEEENKAERASIVSLIQG